MHYPGTYAHGVYNRETTILGGVPVLNEDLVNLPNWLVLKLRIEGEDAIRLADVELLDYRHELDIRGAVMARRLRFRDAAGRETTLRSRRFVSMADPHQAGIEWTLTAAQLVGPGGGRLGDRRPRHQPRRRPLPGARGPASRSGLAPDVRPRRDRAEGPRRASRTCTSARRRGRGSSPAEQPVAVERSLFQTEDYIQQVLAFELGEGAPVRVEKMVALSTSRDPATSDTLTKAGSGGAPPPGLRAGAARDTPAPGRSCGGCATCACAAIRRSSACCGCTSATSCRCARVTPPTWTPACPRAG